LYLSLAYAINTCYCTREQDMPRRRREGDIQMGIQKVGRGAFSGLV